MEIFFVTSHLCKFIIPLCTDDAKKVHFTGHMWFGAHTYNHYVHGVLENCQETCISRVNYHLAVHKLIEVILYILPTTGMYVPVIQSVPILDIASTKPKRFAQKLHL